MTQEYIRGVVPNIRTGKDLLFLLNDVKKDIYGEKCHPFSLKLVTYYCNPARATKAYKHFKIAKKSGGFREISAPTKSLKSIQTCLNAIFQALYEPSDVAKGFIPGKSVIDNASVHAGMNYVFNTDIKDFFPSINQARVWAVLQLKPLNFTREAANIIAGLCCMRIENPESFGEDDRYKYVLPQGSPASPILTNIVCQKLDRRLRGLAHRFELNCSRYADDITFSSSHNVYQKDGAFIKELEKIIEGQNFKMNIGKTRLQTKGTRQEVTGIVVNDKINVNRQYARDLGSMLFIWEHYGLDAAYARFSEYYEKNKPCNRMGGPDFFIRVIKGKLMFMKMVKGDEDPVYRKYLKRFEVLASRKTHEESCDVLSYPLVNFEKEFHTRIDFKYKSETEPSEESLIATTRVQKKNIFVIISKKCRPSLHAVMMGQTDISLAQLKSIFYIARKVDENGKTLWIITHGNLKAVRTASDANPGSNTWIPEAASTGGCEDVMPGTDNLDSVLKQLVDSNFSDLSILSQWDRTKQN